MANPQNLVGQGFHTHPERIRPKPKGARHRSTILKELLSMKVDGFTDREYKVIDALIRKAETEGNVQAVQLIQDTLYGKQTEKHITGTLDDSGEGTFTTAELLSMIPAEVLEAALASKGILTIKDSTKDDKND